MDRVKALECHNFADVLGVEIVAQETPKERKEKLKRNQVSFCGWQKVTKGNRDIILLANESDTKAMTMTYIAGRNWPKRSRRKRTSTHSLRSLCPRT